ncbi:MAG: hypothetical protein KF775_09240 [Cyclobacteriaceae bacterium]|nr:hypothetical protein [Cyclobacteriaceae bacterium]
MGTATYRFVYYDSRVKIEAIEFGTIPASKKKTTGSLEYKGEAKRVKLKSNGSLAVFIETSGPSFQGWDLYVEYDDGTKKRELKTFPISRSIDANGYMIVNDDYLLKP